MAKNAAGEPVRSSSNAFVTGRFHPFGSSALSVPTARASRPSAGQHQTRLNAARAPASDSLTSCAGLASASRVHRNWQSGRPRTDMPEQSGANRFCFSEEFTQIAAEGGEARTGSIVQKRSIGRRAADS